jgi:predicted subunit of tRNA(5-methylaminomethyl-2-thiouridylate) methyltransferase
MIGGKNESKVKVLKKRFANNVILVISAFGINSIKSQMQDAAVIRPYPSNTMD